MPKSLIFCYIYIKYDILDIYVGICVVREKYKFYVFDWCLPISSMFYNYEVGKAKYNTPNGEISGEITSKITSILLKIIILEKFL